MKDMSQMPEASQTNRFVVAALYKFVVIEDCAALQAELQQLCNTHGIMGTLLVATEGLNGTISGLPDAIKAVTGWLRAHPDFSDIDIKYAAHENMPFHRMKVRLKSEIVTMGKADILPSEQAGTYVEPKDWNALITDPDVLVVDTRNDYEIAIGQFTGAENPHTASFRQFPDYAKALAELPEDKRPQKIAMYCTGGIRCEKSTSLMKQMGFDDVYHLKGGILRYLEEIDAKDSLWEGECFVFDSRVSVDHALNAGSYALCHACKMPLSEEDMRSVFYQPGISCGYCHDKTSQQQKDRFAERKRQIDLAEQRGETHIGQHARMKKSSTRQAG